MSGANYSAIEIRNTNGNLVLGIPLDGDLAARAELLRLLPQTPKNWAVIDVETTVRDGSPSPFVSSNKLVATGILSSNATLTLMRNSAPKDCLDLDRGSMLIGHNIKFDLLWLMREHPESVRPALTKLTAWDTMVAHYLLTGQKDKFPTLAQAAERYNLVGKKDTIKNYLDLGVNVDKIPEEELNWYLVHDLVLTGMVAACQMKEAEQLGMTNLILVQCQATLALAEIEHAGMYIDKLEFASVSQVVKDTLSSNWCHFVVSPSLAIPPGTRNADPDKRSLLQAYIYGGKYTFEVPLKVMTKAGGTKTKIERHVATYPDRSWGLISTTMRDQVQDKMPVSDDVLDILVGQKDPVCALVQQYRSARKALSTYLTGITNNTLGEYLHGNIHQASTNTGRTSSSNPNLQNFPEKDEFHLKTIFATRYGLDGKLIEADFSQLEVVALAHLVGPGHLRESIEAGLDIHEMTAFKVYGRKPTAEEHRDIKTLNFGLIYGGSSGQLQKQTGLSESIVGECISAFYGLFPEVRRWQIDNIASVAHMLREEGLPAGHSPKGFPIKYTFMQSKTGRRFYLEQEDNSFRPGTVSVRTTVIKNYPVQGFATGDIVPLVLGVLFRRLYSKPHLQDRMNIINTIHDSFLLDVHNDVYDDVLEILRDTLTRTPEWVEKFYGVKFELPIKAKIKVGSNWHDLKEIK